MGRGLVGASKRSMFVRKIQYFASNSKSGHTKYVYAPLREGIRQAVKVAEMGKRSKSARLPSDIPQGCLAVYVGGERKRFVISMNFLSHPLFKELLKRSEEEFGFMYQGGITISCEPVCFERVLWLIGTNDPAAKTVRVDDLLDKSSTFSDF